MDILICDDNRAFADYFTIQLRSLFAKERAPVKIYCVQSGEEALQRIKAKPPAVLFLDIDMPGINGFEVARQLCTLEERPIIIFLSNQEHLVFESFGFQPFWFLRKAHLSELPQVIKRIRGALINKHQQYSVTVFRNKVTLLLSDIRYFEANGHYVMVHADQPPLRTKACLSDIENDLQHAYFTRCHAGFLVNCEHIEVAGKTELTLNDGTQIPVSRSKAEQTQNMFMSYMRSMRL